MNEKPDVMALTACFSGNAEGHTMTQSETGEHSANWWLAHGESKGYNIAARERDPIIRGLLDSMRETDIMNLDKNLRDRIAHWGRERE